MPVRDVPWSNPPQHTYNKAGTLRAYRVAFGQDAGEVQGEGLGEHAFLRAQNALVGWHQPSPAVSDGTAGEAGSSDSPAPVSSPALPRGPMIPSAGTGLARQWSRITGRWSEPYRLFKLLKLYSSAKSNLSRNPKADTMAIRLSIFGLLRLESTR